LRSRIVANSATRDTPKEQPIINHQKEQPIINTPQEMSPIAMIGLISVKLIR
jgi:hypothetical protein